MNRRIIYILFALLLCGTASARHLAEVGVRGGLSGLTYRSNYGSMMPGPNAGLDLMYTYLSVNHVGVRTGIGLDYSISHFVVNNFSDSYITEDNQGDRILYTYAVDRWQEQHNQLYVSALVQLALDVRGWRFFIGPRFMVPAMMNYSEYAKGVDIAATYPKYGNTLTGDVYSLNLGKKDAPIQTGKMPSKPNIWCTIAAETGYAIPITKDQTLFVGVYANYALNPSITSPGSNISAFQLSEDWTNLPLQRVMSSAIEANQHTNGKPVIERFGYWDAGIKVAWQIYWGYRTRRYNHRCRCEEMDY